MKTTLNLLTEALEAEPEISKAEWCRRLDTDRTAINLALNRGHLSPTLAGQLAAYLNKPVDAWVALAALETAKPAAQAQKLIRKIVQKLYLSTRKRLRAAPLNGAVLLDRLPA